VCLVCFVVIFYFAVVHDATAVKPNHEIHETHETREAGLIKLENEIVGRVSSPKLFDTMYLGLSIPQRANLKSKI
jgi:hypothetical protein